MNRTRSWLASAIVCGVTSVCAVSSDMHAQLPSGDLTLRHEVFAGSIAESYLRYLQSTGKVPLYPWSSRSFSHKELANLIPRDSAHPWHDRFSDSTRQAYGIRYGVIQPASTLRYNSTFPYGSNDGPVWAGRGITSAVQFGGYAEWGPVSLTIAPMLFRAENAAFDIIPNGRIGPAAFANAEYGGVDRPQRFGSSAYSQVDPGQSTLRVDLPYIAVGASTANQVWGPGQELPVVLGNNAAGFPHVFAGTSEPLDLFIAKVHAKVMWGELFQSDYSGVEGSERYVSRAEPGRKRFTTGFVFIAEPRGIPGLELGATRFFHSIWPQSGIPRSYMTKFLQGFLKKDLPADDIDDPRFPGEKAQGISDNQLVSIFARWVLPHSGFELHAEYGREDHSYDFRDLVQEPDHSRAYSIGARRVFKGGPSSLTAGRVEVMNFQLPQLSRYRGEGEFYFHGLLRQGHTFKGQLLGADVGVGVGAGSVMAVDHFTTSGRWTASWTRMVRQENSDYIKRGIRTPRSTDVSHALGFERASIVSDFEVTTGLTFVREFNRDFLRDVSNVNALVGVRYLIH
jgi:hypothetical protein